MNFKINPNHNEAGRGAPLHIIVQEVSGVKYPVFPFEKKEWKWKVFQKSFGLMQDIALKVWIFSYHIPTKFSSLLWKLFRLETLPRYFFFNFFLLWILIVFNEWNLHNINPRAPFPQDLVYIFCAPIGGLPRCPPVVLLAIGLDTSRSA